MKFIRHKMTQKKFVLSELLLVLDWIKQSLKDIFNGFLWLCPLNDYGLVGDITQSIIINRLRSSALRLWDKITLCHMGIEVQKITESLHGDTGSPKSLTIGVLI